jgi:hypothetical protein
MTEPGKYGTPNTCTWSAYACCRITGEWHCADATGQAGLNAPIVPLHIVNCPNNDLPPSFGSACAWGTAYNPVP